MKRSRDDRIVLVTAPSMAVSRRLAKAALQERLVACVNIVPAIESHYWWEDRIEKGAERLLIMKTRESCLARLEEVVHACHPYQVPEFVVLRINAGSERYLNWIGESVATPRRK
ncbi:MAG: divalent-cation tolerance protein CutA [Verrucomicrobiales bacterium]|nr:divalent-cation tolerance protein CutA [Verrucomicrobiales bacterium]